MGVSDASMVWHRSHLLWVSLDAQPCVRVGQQKVARASRTHRRRHTHTHTHTHTHAHTHTHTHTRTNSTTTEILTFKKFEPTKSRQIRNAIQGLDSNQFLKELLRNRRSNQIARVSYHTAGVYCSIRIRNNSSMSIRINIGKYEHQCW